MKVLIIMHSSNTLYGAAKSLQKLIENTLWDVDLVYPNSFFHPVSKETMHSYSGIPMDRLHRLFLPFRKKTVYAGRYSAKEFVWEVGKRVAERIDYYRLKSIISKGQYDYVLLNSIVLYPYADISSNTIVYVREMVVATGILYKRILNKLLKTKKIIFIDKAITKPFNNTKLEYKVINNPFDMTNVNSVKRDEVRQALEIDNQKIIISIIGNVSQDKGIDFVINVIEKLKREDIVLLVVGNGNAEYYNYCVRLSKKGRVYFLGEQKNVFPIYAISDYVIRADLHFATGRTVYEGLYSGCRVIMQKDDDSDETIISKFDEFKNQIYFYRTRNEDSLLMLLEDIKPNQKLENYGRSNIDEYIEQVNGYIK